MWQQSWWLTKKEIKYNGYAFLFTGLATILIALWASLLLDHTVQSNFGDVVQSENFIALDVIFLGLTPSFAALFMSVPYLSFRTIKEDPFSKRMAFYRSLPISIEVLSKSRMMLMLITLLIMSSTFYLTLIIALPERFFEHMTSFELFLFILFWLGYAFGFGGSNTFIEFGTNGKILFIVPIIFLFIFAVIIIFFYQILGQSIVEWSLSLVKNHGVTAVVFSWLFGIIGFILWSQLLTHRLKNRDYV